MNCDGDIVNQDWEYNDILDEYESDSNPNYLRKSYGYNVSAIQVDEPYDKTNSNKNTSTLAININLVADSAPLCNGPLDSSEWLGF